MQSDPLFAWIWVLGGIISGSCIGLFFYRQDWLGGYDAWERRMVRLGHVPSGDRAAQPRIRALSDRPATVTVAAICFHGFCGGSGDDALGLFSFGVETSWSISVLHPSCQPVDGDWGHVMGVSDKMRIGFISMSGVRACDPALLRLGLTLPGFVERGKTRRFLAWIGDAHAGGNDASAARHRLHGYR